MPGKKYTFDTGVETADEYLDTVAGSEIKVSSAKTYEAHLCQYGRSLNNRGLSPCEASLSEIMDHLRYRAEQNLSKSTITKDIVSIKNLYKFLRIEKRTQLDLDFFLLDNVSVSDFDTPTPPDQEPLSISELEQLCKATDCLRNKLIIVIGGRVGPRNEALRKIKLSDVNLESKTIKINNTKTGGSVKIPISDELALQLERWIKIERKSYLSKNSEYLFPSIHGEKLETNYSVQRIVHEAANKAGIQRVVSEREFSEAEKRQYNKETGVQRQYHVTPHTLRRTFAHLLEEAGLSSEARRDALDHEDSSTTEEHYSFSKSDYEDQIRDLFHNDKDKN